VYTPNPTLVTTLSGYQNIQTAQRKYDVSNRINRYLPDASPFTILLKNLNSASVIDATFKILEEQPQPWTDTINNVGGYTAVATSIVVAHASYFKTQDLVKNERTGEIFKVNAAPTVATNTLGTIIRAYAGTVGVAMNNTDPLRIIGSAFEDGSAASAVKIVKVDSNTNYTQRFKEAIQLPDVAIETDLYGEPELDRLRKSKGIEHLKRIEQAMIHGGKALYNTTTAIATTSEELRTTGGILYWLASNVKTLGDGSLAGGGPLTESDFNTWLEDLMKFPGPSGTNKKTLFAAPRLCTVFDGWGRDKLKVLPSDETYGIAVKQYISTHGTINIIKHPMLDGPYFGSYGIAVDMSTVGYRYLKNLDTKLYIDISNRAATSGQVDQYESECGLYLSLEALHGVIKGVNS
jgi:hypothetical protein